MDGEPRFWVIVNRDNYSPAICPAWDQPDIPEEFAGPEAEANARLIAAAPELLEALKRIQDEANTVCGDWRETASLIDSICIAAIAKARGAARPCAQPQPPEEPFK